MSRSELNTFLEMLQQYVEHLSTNPYSLLSKIFGVFTIEKPGMGSVHVMLMENTLKLENPKLLKYVFDLKGSTY